VSQSCKTRGGRRETSAGGTQNKLQVGARTSEKGKEYQSFGGLKVVSSKDLNHPPKKNSQNQRNDRGK